nr:hypothetical protein [Tanacetum cinerariifolium]
MFVQSNWYGGFGFPLNVITRSDITSKESTLQLVYDVLRLTPFYKAFLVTTDVPEIYMEMLHICPRLPNQTFDELPFEEEILAFLRYLEHGREIRKITDVNINELHQPCRSFAVIINKCLIEHKDAKKSNKMYYPRFIKVIIHFFMTKDPSIPRRNKVNWHYFRDDQMFTTIKLVSRHQNTQQFGTILPVELANKDIRNSAAYKEYYAIASEPHLPRLKQVLGRLRVAMTEAEQMKLATKRILQQTHISQASRSGADERTGILLGVPDAPTDEFDEEISWKSSDEDDDDDQDDNDDDQDTDNDSDDLVHPKLSIHEEETKDEESFDPIIQTPKNSDDEGNDDASLGMNVGGEEGQDVDDDDEELYRDVNINLEGRDVQMTYFHTTQEFEDTHVTLTPVNHDGQQQIAPLTLTAPTLLPPTIPTISQLPQAPTPPKTTPSTFLQDLLNFGSLFGFDHRLKTLEANFFEFVQTNQFAGAVSSILGIVERYMDQRMNKAIKVAVQLQSNRLRDEAQAENEDFINKLDENIQKIINEQVNEQVKIKMKNPPLDQTGGPREEEKEKNQSQQALQRKRQPRPLASLLKDVADNQPIAKASHHPEWFQKQKKPPTLDRAWNKTLPATHESIQPWISDLAKQADSRSSFNELMDTPVDFSAFLMNQLKVDILTPKLLVGLTYEPMKGLCKSLVELEFFLEEVYKATTDQLDWNNPERHKYPHNLLKPLPLIPNSRGRRVIPFDHFINNDLEYLRGGAFSRKYTTSVTKTKAEYYGHIKWIEDLVPRIMWSQEPVSYDKYALWGICHWGHKRQQFYGFAVNRESARDVYSKHDDNLYKFKEGDFKRLRIQDIKDMLLLLVQGKLTNLTVEERFAFNVSLRMFTISIVIQQRVEDLQLGVKSYQKKLKLTKPDTDGTLNDVRTTLDDRLKGIRMKYLPQAIWRKSDKERATAMIQAIDKQLKMRRIMQSLEKFVGRRLYEGDFRMLQRTI